MICNLGCERKTVILGSCNVTNLLAKAQLVILICQTKPKGVTTQMKALDEYILMVLFVLLLKRVHFLQTKPKGVTTQMKALDEYILKVCVSTEEFIFL